MQLCAIYSRALLLSKKSQVDLINEMEVEHYDDMSFVIYGGTNLSNTNLNFFRFKAADC